MKTNKSGARQWTTFSTPIGLCGLVWQDHAISAFLLPEKKPVALEARLAAASGQAEPAAECPSWVEKLMGKIAKHLGGVPQDFSQLDLDLAGVSAFKAAVYSAACQIPPGNVKTYGEIAAAIGKPAAARAVGMALGANPIALIVPCHRVVGANRQLGGFSAFGGQGTKKALLALEGVVADSLGRP